MERLEFKCDLENCEKKYSNPFNLKRHIESFHKGIKKFFCAVCKKGLSSKQNLREHSNIHLGIKPYVCKYKDCKQAFRQASQLTLHQSMHVEVEKYFQPTKHSLCKDVNLLTQILTAKVNKALLNNVFDTNKSEKIVLPPIRFEIQPQDPRRFWPKNQQNITS